MKYVALFLGTSVVSLQKMRGSYFLLRHNILSTAGKDILKDTRSQ